MKPDATIREIIGRKGATVWSVEPELSVYEAVEILSTHDIGALPVISEGQLLGMFSERDYARKIVLEGKSSRSTRVTEIMTSPVVCVCSRDTVSSCLKEMTDKKIRHLPVLERKKVVGIVSIGDLVMWIISAQEEEIGRLETYIAGTYPG